MDDKVEDIVDVVQKYNSNTHFRVRSFLKVSQITGWTRSDDFDAVALEQWGYEEAWPLWT